MQGHLGRLSPATATIPGMGTALGARHWLFPVFGDSTGDKGGWLLKSPHRKCLLCPLSCTSEVVPHPSPCHHLLSLPCQSLP